MKELKEKFEEIIIHTPLPKSADTLTTNQLFDLKLYVLDVLSQAYAIDRYEWIPVEKALRIVDDLTEEEIKQVALLRGYRSDFLNLAEGKELAECYNENRRYLKTFSLSEVRWVLMEYLKSIGIEPPKRPTK